LKEGQEKIVNALAERRQKEVERHNPVAERNAQQGNTVRALTARDADGNPVAAVDPATASLPPGVSIATPPLDSNVAPDFKRNYLIAGGALSGFFGGLAGIQGALRSAFLIKSGLSKEAYIATGVIIASLVDITRLSVYATRFRSSGLSENTVLIISAILAAIAGAAIGNLLLKKVTYGSIRVLVAVMLFLVSLALGAGIL
jgi:uncharacterized membrane protein YfcA